MKKIKFYLRIMMNNLILLLKQVEKYFQTDLLYIFRGGFWLISSQIVASASSLILAITFSRLLPKDVYGNYKYILSIAAIISSFSLTGIGVVIAQSVARKYDGMLKLGIKYNLRYSLLGTSLSIILSIYYFINKNYDLAAAAVIIATLSPLLNSFSLYSYFLNGKRDFERIAKLGFIPDLVSTLSLIITILLTKNIIAIVLVYFISNLVPNIIAYLLTIKKYTPTSSVVETDITYARHLSIMNMAQIVVAQIDKVIIFHFLGAVQLAIYFFAIALPEQIRGFMKIGGALSLPKFSSNHERLDINNILTVKIPKLALASTIITVIYIVIAPLIYKILFPQYLDSIYYSQVFSLNIILTTSTMIITQVLQVKYQTKNLYFLNLTVSFLQIILLVAFIYSIGGIIGIIYARIVGNIIGLIISYILATKVTGRQISLQ